MCSVFGYVGSSLGRNRVLEGLARLEYRGYDSAGFACLDAQSQQLALVKAAGTLDNLHAKLATFTSDGFVCLGHTRWSTHGASTEHNAHPHTDCTGSLALVHNGIIENYHHFKVDLQQAGHYLQTQTDTEIIVHLLEDALAAHNDMLSAVVKVVQALEGAYAFAFISVTHPDTIVAVRYRSPLCVARSAHETYIVSDPLACAGYADQVWYVPESSIVIITQRALHAYTFAGEPLVPVWQSLTCSWQEVSKQQYRHFMLKEIHEQKRVIHGALQQYLLLGMDILALTGIAPQSFKELTTIHMVGAGTSWHAGRIGQFFLEDIAGIKVEVHLASEFRYKSFFPDAHGLYLLISRSGETADTLEALRLIRANGLPTVALTDIVSSSLVRESTGYLLTYAGAEIAVASTKAFTAQVVALYWFAHVVAVARGLLPETALVQVAHEVEKTGSLVEQMIRRYEYLIEHELAPRYAACQRFIFLGRHISYPFAQEAALKLKEISYIAAQCYPAGELKHGPIALVDPETPVILFSHSDDLLYQKLLSNAQEIKARNGHLIVFGFEGQDELEAIADVFIAFPRVPALLGPLVMAGVMQLFAYAIAAQLQRPIDKPRNLAKSVTVE